MDQIEEQTNGSFVYFKCNFFCFRRSRTTAPGALIHKITSKEMVHQQVTAVEAGRSAIFTAYALHAIELKEEKR